MSSSAIRLTITKSTHHPTNKKLELCFDSLCAECGYSNRSQMPYAYGVRKKPRLIEAFLSDFILEYLLLIRPI